MLKKISSILAVTVFMFVVTGATMGQDDLTFVLTRAKVNVDDASRQSIEVLFGESSPEDEAVRNKDHWRVIAIDENGDTQTYLPETVDPDKLNKEAILHMAVSLASGGPLDPATHKIIVRYQEHNLPTVVLGSPKKKGPQKVFTAAKGKKDADIYFSGSATGQRGSGPVYSIEAKAGYLQSLREKGAIGGRFTFASDAGSDIDPDSITASGTYQKIFVFDSTKGIILNSDFLGGEFDKEGQTLNLTTELDGTLVLPSKHLGENTFATMDFMGGFEAGHNYKNPLNTQGLGNFWRPKFGVNAYLVALAPPKIFNRINLSASYIVRLPQSAEPFTQKVSGSNITSLTKKPRHHVDLDLGLMFAPSYGLTISYRYGSLPPDFKFVDHKVAIGFTLQLKQAKK
jgi:hypothetical protein